MRFFLGFFFFFQVWDLAVSFFLIFRRRREQLCCFYLILKHLADYSINYRICPVEPQQQQQQHLNTTQQQSNKSVLYHIVSNCIVSLCVLSHCMVLNHNITANKGQLHLQVNYDFIIIYNPNPFHSV